MMKKNLIFVLVMLAMVSRGQNFPTIGTNSSVAVTVNSSGVLQGVGTNIFSSNSGNLNITLTSLGYVPGGSGTATNLTGNALVQATNAANGLLVLANSWTGLNTFSDANINSGNISPTGGTAATTNWVSANFQTNGQPIQASTVTNLGSAAYSNSAAFYPATGNPSGFLTNNATRGTVNLNSLSLAGSFSSDNANIFTDGSGNLTAQSLTGSVMATGGNILTNAVATTGTNNAVSVANNTVTVQFNTNLPASSGGGVTWLVATNYNIVPDGVTDNTTNMQSFLNKAGALYFPKGNYLAQELWITNNTRIVGDGAVWIYATNAANTNIFVKCMLNTNISIEGITFDGQINPSKTTNFITYSGTNSILQNLGGGKMTYWNPTGFRGGLEVNGHGSGSFKNLTLRNFSRSGFIVYGSQSSTYSMSVNKAEINNVNCYNNFVGVYASGIMSVDNAPYNVLGWYTNEVPGCLPPEYVTLTDLNCYNNTVGAQIDAGNIIVQGGKFSRNIFNIMQLGGVNPCHGTFTGCLFNHADNYAFYSYNNTSGELITGCQFRSGATEAIYLSACIGYVFQNCQFNYLTITNVNSYPGDNYFLDNTLDSAWSTVNLSTDGHLIHFHNRRFYTGNDSDNDATFGTFSSQNWTNLTGMPVAVNMASATSVAVFNLFGSNLVSAAVSPSYFILQPRGYTTNATGTGSYYGAP